MSYNAFWMLKLRGSLNFLVFKKAFNSLEQKYETLADKLTFGEDFLVNEKMIDTNYSRFDSPYVNAEKKDKTINIEFNGKSLFLDFENMNREIR